MALSSTSHRSSRNSTNYNLKASIAPTDCSFPTEHSWFLTFTRSWMGSRRLSLVDRGMDPNCFVLSMRGAHAGVVALAPRRRVLAPRTPGRPLGLVFESITSSIMEPLRPNSASWSRVDTNDMAISSTIQKERYFDTRLAQHTLRCLLGLTSYFPYLGIGCEVEAVRCRQRHLCPLSSGGWEASPRRGSQCLDVGYRFRDVPVRHFVFDDHRGCLHRLGNPTKVDWDHDWCGQGVYHPSRRWAVSHRAIECESL